MEEDTEVVEAAIQVPTEVVIVLVCINNLATFGHFIIL